MCLGSFQALVVGESCRDVGATSRQQASLEFGPVEFFEVVGDQHVEGRIGHRVGVSEYGDDYVGQVQVFQTDVDVNVEHERVKYPQRCPLNKEREDNDEHQADGFALH